MRILKDIPELVEELREEKKHNRDIVVPSRGIQMFSGQEGLGLQIKNKDMEASFDIQKQVHTMLAPRLGIPSKYYSKMREEAPALLCKNTNWWFDVHGDQGKQRLIRISRDSVRAVLSNRYRPIDHLDVVTTAMQAVSDREDAENYAGDAKCFNWSLSAMFLDVCFVNPGIVIDLNHLERGVQIGLKHHKKGDGGGSQFVYAGRVEESDDDAQGGWFQRKDDDEGGHYVFPAARIRNSETGFGSLHVMAGLYEAVCDNSCWLGTNLAKTHVGSQLAEGEEYFSSDTYRKMNAVIFSQVRDIVKAVFDPDKLLENAKRMKGLSDINLSLSDAQNQLVKMPAMTEDIRDEILNAYEPLQTGRSTLLDVQRAVTKSAQSFSDKPDKAFMLESLGGKIVESGLEALQV